MENQFERIEMLLGKDAVDKLKRSSVAVFGIGGVGGFTAEALVRSGVGALDIIDNDAVALSNLNRQIIALHSTLGKLKVDVAEERFLDINPDLKLNKHDVFYTPETSESFDFTRYDYIVDAIDTITGKIELIVNAEKAGTPIISSMGAGNKLSGIKNLKVVYSKEKPLSPMYQSDNNERKKAPASSAFTPSVAGLIIASEVVKDLIKL